MYLRNALAAALGGFGGLVGLARAAPSLILDLDFPDPAILQDPKSGKWYAFATAGNDKIVQMASAPVATGPWTRLDKDPLPKTGAWAVQTGVWAPDVRYLAASGRFVLYYSGEHPDTGQHCVGAATSDTIDGPYDPVDEVLACPLSQGGAIDPSGYFDEATNTRWLVYKVDGNSVGNGGSCGNTVEPIVPTPIMMQQVELDGHTRVGDPFEILDRGDADGPLVEAPNLVRAGDGTFVLFFSSNCYASPLYDVSYATAPTLTGPYTKSSQPLLVTGDYDLTAPGGATSTVGGGRLFFHADCDVGRCMYQTAITVSDNVVSIDGLSLSIGDRKE